MTFLNRVFIIINFFCFSILVVNGQGQIQIDYGNNKEAGNYKKINGINLYYEIYGVGKPLILLHGN